DAVNLQLARHGYIARGGQMIDAFIFQAPKQSLNKEENPSSWTRTPCPPTDRYRSDVRKT
ncbi:MAG: IS5/IS1182 family transposase, partial [Burkholderiaceae bacterium]|nr:IS5/IS1182 family transposase [Burkholderiaceae bacterium]